MFQNRKKLTVFISSFALAMSALAAAAPAQAVGENGQTPGQVSLDTDGTNNGSWFNTTVGVTGRPFVTSLKINGDEILTQIPDDTGDNFWTAGSNRFRALVQPFNACKDNQLPTSGQCYANPNRVGIAIGYTGSDNEDDIKTNFAHTDASSMGIDENDEIDLTINMNAMSSNLGWTWLNGKPEYWNVATSGAATSIRVKFRPRFMPSTSNMGNTQCTTIPVSTCDVEQSSSEMLLASMVVSVDQTNAIFAGTLFGSESAVIGSLEANLSTALTSNSLTYGIASTHKTSDGTVRKGKLYGVVSNTLLNNSFGLTDPTQASTLLSVSRTTTSTGGTDAVTWESWTSASNGIDAQFVTISDITFSAPKFQMTRKSSASVSAPAPTAAAPVSVVKGKSRTKKAILTDVGLVLAKGEKATIKIAKASRKVCTVSGSKVKAKKKGTCSYTVTVKNKKGKKVKAKTKTGSFLVS